MPAKIVVIEDDTDLQFMYKLKLERVGHKVKVASDGVEGLQTVTQVRPDLILLDLNLPIMSGAEMLARLRENEWAANMRVVVLTNFSKTEAPPALRFLAVDRYVVKAHHTPAQVIEIIDEVLKSGAPM